MRRREARRACPALRERSRSSEARAERCGGGRPMILEIARVTARQLLGRRRTVLLALLAAIPILLVAVFRAGVARRARGSTRGLREQRDRRPRGHAPAAPRGAPLRRRPRSARRSRTGRSSTCWRSRCPRRGDRARQVGRGQPRDAVALVGRRDARSPGSSRSGSGRAAGLGSRSATRSASSAGARGLLRRLRRAQPGDEPGAGRRPRCTSWSGRGRSPASSPGSGS